MNKQLEINIYKGKHGGYRPGSGRKVKHSSGVRHRSRERVTKHLPLHINFKYKTTIRSDYILRSLERGIENAARHNLEVTYFTLQSNHIHLIAEASDNKSLSYGMRAITVTLTRALNKGSIQTERYHLHVLKTPAEVKNAIHYVLHNDIKHTGKSFKKFTKKLSDGKSWLLKSSTKKEHEKQRSGHIG